MGKRISIYVAWRGKSQAIVCCDDGCLQSFLWFRCKRVSVLSSLYSSQQSQRCRIPKHILSNIDYRIAAFFYSFVLFFFKVRGWGWRERERCNRSMVTNFWYTDSNFHISHFGNTLFAELSDKWMLTRDLSLNTLTHGASKCVYSVVDCAVRRDGYTNQRR